MKEKIKGLAGNKEILTVLLIILVGTASFGLGRLSVGDPEKEPVKIVAGVGEVVGELNKNSTAAAASTNSSGQVVASKSGSKYHYPWCPGASQIKEANKIYFDSIEKAKQAGYTKAANCEGL